MESLNKLLLIFGFCVILSNITLATQDQSSTIPRNFKLELVQVLFRHGERTPLDNEYQAYPYLTMSMYQPYEFGELTNRGKGQMYNVGRTLRERYNGFLNKKYSSEEVYAYSSEDDRTKMSLQLVLAGLYPPSPGLVWNPDLEWQPLPFRYTPKEVDILMRPYVSKKFRGITQTVFQLPDYIREMSKCSHAFDLISNVTGKHVAYNDIGIATKVVTLLGIHDTLGLPLPQWYTREIKQNLRACSATFLRFQGHTLMQKKLNGGSMIRTTAQNMNLNGILINPRKIYLYSGHDLTLNGFLRALGIREPEVIEFGHTLILEKFRDSKNRLFVRLLVYSPINGKIAALRIGNCNEFCPADDYKKHILNVMPNKDEMNTLLNEFNANRINELFFGDKIVKVRHYG